MTGKSVFSVPLDDKVYTFQQGEGDSRTQIWT